jgi:primosomal protein N''
MNKPNKEGGTVYYLLKYLYEAKEDLDRLIRELENDPTQVNFGADRIYNIESSLKLAQKHWHEEVF